MTDSSEEMVATAGDTPRKFDPNQHVIKVQGGRSYLPVAARLVWFRSEHPDWGIVTHPVEINMEKQYAIFGCSIFNSDGKLMATATKMEDVRGFGDFLEKAETGSVGRALAYCGYGTQFAPELEESTRFADAPQQGRGQPPATAKPEKKTSEYLKAIAEFTSALRDAGYRADSKEDIAARFTEMYPQAPRNRPPTVEELSGATQVLWSEIDAQQSAKGKAKV